MGHDQNMVGYILLFPGDDCGCGTGLINMPLMKNTFYPTVEKAGGNDIEWHFCYNKNILGIKLV